MHEIAIIVAMIDAWDCYDCCYGCYYVKEKW